jgi:hypothetical protein
LSSPHRFSKFVVLDKGGLGSTYGCLNSTARARRLV